MVSFEMLESVNILPVESVRNAIESWVFFILFIYYTCNPYFFLSLKQHALYLLINKEHESDKFFCIINHICFTPG